MPAIRWRRLNALLAYDRRRGVFRWKKTLGGKRKAARRAGWKNADGYWMIGIDHRHYYAHRLAFFLLHRRWPKEIDHRNVKRDKNGAGNLREANRQQQSANTKRSRANTSGVKGVHWDNICKKWRARISVERKSIHLGLFSRRRDAAAAYRKAAILYFGKFARFS